MTHIGFVLKTFFRIWQIALSFFCNCFQFKFFTGSLKLFRVSLWIFTVYKNSNFAKVKCCSRFTKYYQLIKKRLFFLLDVTTMTMKINSKGSDWLLDSWDINMRHLSCRCTTFIQVSSQSIGSSRTPPFFLKE